LAHDEMTNWNAREKPNSTSRIGAAKYPHLPAHLTGDGRQLRVWCCWCACWHYHGAGSPGEDEYPVYGHRVAHCHADSPYAMTGYVLTDPAKLERKR
jgi:hypothetical protein